MVGELTVPGGMAASIIAQAAAGDADALARIVGAHHDDMARLCFVICGDQDLAQDAVQAAWPVAWRKLGSLRDPDRLRPWLMSVAANEARQLLRRRRHEDGMTGEVKNIGPQGGDPATGAAVLDLAAALLDLRQHDRTLPALPRVTIDTSSETGRSLGS